MNRNRDDYFSWNEPGEIEILEMQCEQCKHKLDNPLVCTKYPDGKPEGVLRVEEECPEFENKKKRGIIWDYIWKVISNIKR